MKRKTGVLLLLAFSVLASACGGAGPERLRGQADAMPQPGGPGDGENGDAAVGSMEISIDTGDMFTDRDKRTDYEAEIFLTLSDDGVTAEVAAETSAKVREETSVGEEAVLADGNTVTIRGEGTYVLSGTLSDGMIIVDAGETDKVCLVLDGVRIHSETSAAVYVKQADKVFVTLADGAENTLSNGGSFVATDDKNIDAAVFSRADLTLNGSGSLVIASSAGHGIVSKDDLVVTGGNYEITAAQHGLSGKDSVRIADGVFEITAQEDGIHGDNDEDETKGFCYIAGGTFTVNAGDDGIHASGLLYVEGGDIAIAESYEGLEGKQVAVAGGNITVHAKDDGINAAPGAEDTWIWISGGVVSVNADGDGIDSNGDVKIDGGTITVSGPCGDGDGTLDYNGAAAINGGVFMGTGSAGMAQGFGTNSAQGSVLAAVGAQEAGSVVTLRDAGGTELVSWTAEKDFACVNVSCPGLVAGGVYTLTAGSFETEFEMSGITYAEGAVEAGGMGGAGGRKGGKPRMENPPTGDENFPPEGENPPAGEENPPQEKGI